MAALNNHYFGIGVLLVFLLNVTGVAAALNSELCMVLTRPDLLQFFSFSSADNSFRCWHRCIGGISGLHSRCVLQAGLVQLQASKRLSMSCTCT